MNPGDLAKLKDTEYNVRFELENSSLVTAKASEVVSILVVSPTKVRYKYFCLITLSDGSAFLTKISDLYLVKI
jgi:hypothetical protein